MFGWNWFRGSQEEDFFDFVNVFFVFRNYLPLEQGRALHLKKNLNPLYPRMLCAKFGWNWPSGSGEEDENVKYWPQQWRQKSRFSELVKYSCYPRNQTTFSAATQKMLNFPKTFNKKYNIYLSIWEFTVKKNQNKILSCSFVYIIHKNGLFIKTYYHNYSEIKHECKGFISHCCMYTEIKIIL